MSISDVQEKINALSVYDVVKLLENYQHTNNTDIKTKIDDFIFDDFQNKLQSHGINSNCPYCKKERIVGFGSNGKIKRFKCKDCGKTFTLFTGTILEKTKYGWDVWIKMTEMILNHYPMEHMLEALIKDFGLDNLDLKTIFLWTHKILHAMTSMPCPSLSGVVQIDETFFRESQKGSRNLFSPIKNEERKPRYGRIPSKYGTMGNEFANVVAAVDQYGYCVAKVISLGRLTEDVFVETFDKYFHNLSFICTDANAVYKHYCSQKDILHYVIPSHYLDTLTSNGYVLGATSDEEKRRNEKIKRDLYQKGKIDYIDEKQLDYDTFTKIKNAHSLSLGKVNQFHSELKRFIEYNTKGVSTKYLPDYIGAHVFIHNWKISNGRYPTSNKDAESILISILKNKISYTSKDMEAQFIDFPKASCHYMGALKQKTESIRKLSKNKYFKYDEEDNVISFNKRIFLEDIPEYKFKKLCSKYKIPSKWAKYSKISELLKKDDIWDEILLLISETRHYDISEEDLKAIKAKEYSK